MSMKISPLKKKILIAVLFALSLPLFITTSLWAAGYAATPITNSTNAFEDILVDNGQVIWETYDVWSNGVSRIYLYDIAKATTTELTSGYSCWNYEPQVSGGKVVWEGYDANNYGQIFLYDGVKTIQLTSGNNDNLTPQISNGMVVWEGVDDITGQSQICLYNIAKATTTKLTGGIINNDPQINSGLVAWEGSDANGNNSQIYLYDIAKAVTTQLVGSSYYNWAPQLNNGQVVWCGYNGGAYYQLLLYDGAKTIKLADNNSPFEDFQINNGQVAWDSYDGISNQIYLYDIAKAATTQLTNTGYDIYNEYPQIGNGWVVWQGEGSGNLYLYDIAKATTIQFPGGGSARINNGMVTWNGQDSNGNPAIFLYDGTNLSQIGTGTATYLWDYQISGNQVVWGSYDSTAANYQVWLAMPQSLEMLDGADFSAGNTISTITAQLSTGGTPMQGAVTDGVSRLLLRLQTSDATPVTFSMAPGDSPNPQADNGYLEAIGSQGNPQQPLPVTPVNVNGTYYAFAVYQAPKHFARDKITADATISERIATLTVKSSNQAVIATQDIKLDRPPLLLIHGLWDGPWMWNNLQPFLENQISGIKVYRVDYHSTNDVPFSKNKNVPYSYGSNVGDKDKGDSIKIIKATYKANKIAICQVDILAHSMGGVLARIWAGSGEGNNAYLRNKNFKSGDYHKLITLDTPHNGSFLADAGLACLRDPSVIAGNYQDINRLLTLLVSTGHSLSNGATDDLRTPQANPGGPIAVMDGTAVNVLTHAIVGHYVNFTVYSDLLFGALQISGLPGDYANMQNILDRHGFSTIPYIVDGSDLVVSNSSQQAGLGVTYYLTLYHDHTHAVTLEVFNHLVELLNADENSKLFANGYPVTQ